MIEGEIIINLPQPTTSIKLVSSDDIKAHFEKMGKTVPFTFVGLPYVEIGGIWYAVLPVEHKEKKNEL